MVFESIVVDVLNRFLGDYVQNLDSKQLKIGIWGGDVVLHNLVLKQTALDDLDLPVKTVYGRLGKLVLKIPWKNLYGAPVEAEVEKLFLLAVPNQEVKYDAEKEEKWAKDSKQAELQRIEDAKKKEASKGLPKPNDTFVEKLTTQIIKNVQLKISNIHVRYEDKVTNPKKPFAMGITLSELSVETTDDKWNPAIVQDAISKIYKVLNLEGLAVYWNCDTDLYSNLPTDDITDHFQNEIASKSFKPKNYLYVLGPINSSARLRLNPKPETDDPEFSFSKVLLNVEMEKLAIGISKSQYQDIIMFAESMDRMTRALPYRKYRPNVKSYHGYYKEWWKFAYTCILEEEVRRKQRNWDWNHIMSHRKLCKEYASSYQDKLQHKKMLPAVTAKLEECEKKLDLINLVVIRQKIELEVERIGKAAEEKAKKQSWWSSWFGSGATEEDKEIGTTAEIMKKFEAAMTPDEKSKLYRAIDYKENSGPTEYPETFVAMSCAFVLRSLEVEVRDDLQETPRVLSASLSGVNCRIEQRPAANALKVAMKIDLFTVFGIKQGDIVPELVSSKLSSNEEALLDVLFETNPLDKLCSQRVHVSSRPLQIIYDAQTIIKIVDVFKAPESNALNQLQAAANSQLVSFKEMSATGLQYAIEQHSYMELNIALSAPYILVPQNGLYTGVEPVLVVNLGHITMSTLSRDENISVKKMHRAGTSEDEILKEMISQSYEKFLIKLNDVEVVISMKEENWTDALNKNEVTPLHLLYPTSLIVNLDRCLITDDPRLPKMKIAGSLPSLGLNITDSRLMQLVSLFTSIPFPESEEVKTRPIEPSSRTSSMLTLRAFDIEKSKKEHPKNVDLVQTTDLDIKFEMKELFLTIFRTQTSSDDEETESAKPEKLLKFDLLSLEFEMVQQTFNKNIIVRLGGIGLSQYRPNDTLSLISTPMTVGKSEYLFTVTYTAVDKNSVEFHSKYGSCEQAVDLLFTNLGILLHQEGLQTLLLFANDFQSQLEKVTANKDRIASAGGKMHLATIAEDSVSLRGRSMMIKRSGKKRRADETIQFKLNARLDTVYVKLANNVRELAKLAINGVDAEIILKKSCTQVVAMLQDIVITNPIPGAVHTSILECLPIADNDEAMKVEVVIYNLDETSEPDALDMSVTANLGGMRIVFLNFFVATVLDFLNKFQAAQQAIIDASAAAAETAKHNVQNAYAKATRIQLSVKLKAPVIIVPTNSSSLDAVIVDLGNLKLSNKFISMNTTNDEGHDAILDELQMILNDMKISRVAMDEQYEPLRECVLLEPISFVFVVKRNLSAAWYRNVPEIELSGKLKTIELSLSQEDLKMVMLVLNENMSEGVQGAPTKRPPDTHAETRMASTTSHHVALAALGHDVPPKFEEEVHRVHTFLMFTFSMDSLIFNLYTGGSKRLSSTDSAVRSPQNGLARFSLHVLSLKGRMLSDNTLCTSVVLVDCLLDDTRFGREGKLTRLMERRTDLADEQAEGDTVKSMIDITFQQKASDMFVDVRVFSFKMIISTEYLMKIADFFVKAVAEDPDRTDRPTVKGAATHVQSTPRVAASKVASKVEQTPAKENSMTVNLRVEKPDIILVENMDTVDSDALILNSEVLLKVRMTGPHQVINGSIKDLTLFTCNYNIAKRHETTHMVLAPLSISLAGSTPSPETIQGLHLEVIITDVRLSVSPATIELLSRVNQALTSGNVEQVEDETVVEDFSNVWIAKLFEESQYWFLKTEVATEAGEESSVASERAIHKNEVCLVSAPSVIVTVEAGIGNKTLPMILLETSLKGAVRDWSSKMCVDAALTLQIGYYNSRLALWEPLIEPVEEIIDGKSKLLPWELKLEVAVNNSEEDVASTSPVSEKDFLTDYANQSPDQTIKISSKDNLELTMTKTCLDVLTNLGKAFSAAIKEHSRAKHDSIAPFEVRNDSGLQVTLMLDQGSFRIFDASKENYTEILLESGASVPLQVKPEIDTTASIHLKRDTSMSSFAHSAPQRTLQIKVNEMNCELKIPVVRADKRFFSLNHRGEANDKWGLISDVMVQDGGTIVTLRSILQVHNHFNQAIDVYYMTSRGNEVELVTSVGANNVVNLPMNAVYTPTSEIFFGLAGYSVSKTPFAWKDLQVNLALAKLVECRPKPEKNEKEGFFMKALGEIEQVYFEQTTKHTMTSACYHVHLRPAVSLRNCLPLPIVVCLADTAEEHELPAGELIHLPSVEPGRSNLVVRLPEYLEKEWSCRHEIPANPTEFSVWQFHSHDSIQKVTLDLGIHVSNTQGSLIMSLYCPFWMLNKTGLMLAYRNTDEALNILHHPENFKGPILFSFSSKNFFGKKKASIRIEQGEWSDKFSIDVAGSSGVVVCRANGIVYQIGVHNQLTYNSLTKQITFTPFYVLINRAPFTIETQELERPGDSWIRVLPDECQALWPRSERDEKLLRVRCVDSIEISKPFLITQVHTTLLRLDNKYGGVNVDIQVNEGAIYISFTHYQPGQAPALIINHCGETIKYWEKETINIRELPTQYSVLYTWENPAGPRTLVWDSGMKLEVEDELRKDGIGEMHISEQKVYWVSFLDGMQRVLLFTNDISIAQDAQAAGEFESVQQEITVSIHGLGMSLVNNLLRKEITYIGIASSGVIWETCKNKRYKALSIKDCAMIEDAYQHYLQRLIVDMENVEGKVLVDPKLEVNFTTMEMLRPHKRNMRRTFQTGLWFQMKTTPRSVQLHAKVNRLQIDNQLHDCIFPVVLAPVPPPKSVAADTALKPFAELSIVKRIMKHSAVQQFKYFKVLIQEFHVKVDISFINALLEIFQAEETSEKESLELFHKDIGLVDEPLLSHVSTQSLQEQKNFYDLLHFSPLKIHVSFSLQGGAGASAGTGAVPQFITVLLQGLGVTLTDMQDVVFKLGYFERQYKFLTQRQLTSEASSHYVGQLVKQLYVLVLGLDVIGNPFGLVLGLTKGVEDLFYEPFQGAIQGPGEFAEGLVLGVRSLFGHTVGGAAGAVSRITGAMGKGIAALTFDEEYQRKRREQMNKRPNNIQEGIARGGKGIVMGVVDGVTGVFVKPISGAKEQGVEGFFKGLGKGALGLVTRPTAGVVDFASGSFDAVKRAAEVGEEVTRLRPPRFMKGDGLVRPYVRLEAEGHKLLMELEKGKYAHTDIYVHHCWVIERKDILLLTDKRVAYVVHNDIFGGWQIEWSHTWQEIIQPPQPTDKGILLLFQEQKKKKLGLFGSHDNGKTILITDPKQRDSLVSKMEQLRTSII